LRFTIKAYACKMPNHAPVNAVAELMREQGLKAGDVESITIGVPEQTVVGCGWWPYVPKGLTAAQLHTGFCVATQLIEGDVFVDQMVEENIARPDLVDLANRVRNVRSVERERKGNDYRYGADVGVKLKNGKTLQKTVDFPIGSNLRPLTSEQMASKFRRLAAKALPVDKVAEIERIIWGLEREATVRPLIKGLQRDGKLRGA
jgi:aconitate decarboxylase